MSGNISNTNCWKANFYALAEKIADNIIDEAQAKRDYMQNKLSSLFCNVQKGIENFSEDNFLTELRLLGFSPESFPYDSNLNCYKIHLTNHTFYLFCTEFITFFSQNAYNLSTDDKKDGSINITSYPTKSIARILLKADTLSPQWENQWPETFRLATKLAKQFAIDSRTIDAIASSFLASRGKYSIEHHIGKSTLTISGQSFPLDHNSFVTNYAKTMGEIVKFINERSEKC